ARLLVDSHLPAGAIASPQLTPAAHVIVLDDDIVLAGLHDDAVLLRALDGEATHDHVVGLDANPDRLRIRHVDDRAGRRLVQHVAAGTAALGDLQRGRLAANGDGLRNRELLVPRARDETRAR